MKNETQEVVVTLKPCPHCGGPAETIHRNNDTYMVRCEECWCQSRDCADPQSAITAWDTRLQSNQPAAEGLVEAMARAFYERQREIWMNDHPDDDFIAWDDCQFEAFKEDWRDTARTALAARKAQGEGND